jgi:hypothetical protein
MTYILAANANANAMADGKGNAIARAIEPQE